MEIKQDWNNSDYVSMHCPLTKSTKHMINKETLSLMKPSAFIVNSSRGALIDKTAAGFDSGWQYKEIYGGKSNECRIKSIVSDEINMDGISWQELNNCVKEKRECYIMINLEKLQNALVEYKKIFDERWQGEKYKWEAVKWFQDHYITLPFLFYTII